VSLVAAIGDEGRLAGYALAGVKVHGAGDGSAARQAWRSLADEVACVILTVDAYRALEPVLHERADLIWAVVPN
jgi:vacuolar-type H+-ATPase subunit F/Vma7